MEDGREYVDDIVKEDFESQILKSRNSLQRIFASDAEYLKLYYLSQTQNTVDTFEGYKNYVNQSYEPTYFMDESYMPPRSFWGRCVLPFEPSSKSPELTPTAREMIIPAKKTSFGTLQSCEDCYHQVYFLIVYSSLSYLF